MTVPQPKPLHEMKSEISLFLRKTQMPPRRSVGSKKLPMGGTLPRKKQQSGTLYLHRLTVEAQ